MKASRTQKAIINTSCELLLEVVTAICSFILPKLILSHFGSTYNGITSSITQFISCVALLKSGIGSVTRAALYKPLAEKNEKGISEVVNATAGFMKKIAIIFVVVVLVLAAIYPFFVISEFKWTFTFTLVLILSISTFAQYFFGLTYQMVLQADQKNYVISIITIASTIANTLMAAVLISLGLGIHTVKLGSALIFIIPPIYYNVWVKKRYKINKQVKSNYNLISQRWDAFGHQLANFINTNTGIMIITIFLEIKEVSVYTIYFMIGNSIKKIIIAISTGTTAVFGNMLAKNERDTLALRFKQYELLIFYSTTILLTITGLLLTPFVSIYTNGIMDANYYRPIFGYLICISIYIACIKIPYEQLVFATGEFKKTRNGALIEASINISLSIILVNFIGLNGIIGGSIVALMYRTMKYNIYVNNHIIENNKNSIYSRLLFSIISSGISILISQALPLYTINSYSSWFVWAIVVSGITVIVTTLCGKIFFKNEIIVIVKLIVKLLKRNKDVK